MEIIEWYGKKIEELPDDPMTKSPWGYGMFTNGESITRAQRTIYRERVDLQGQFPDPFDCSHPKSYYQWWRDNARKEYPNIFDEFLQKKELDFINSAQTPGFEGAGSNIDWKAVGRNISQGLINRAFRKKMAGRCWEIIRSEGFSGIVSRIRSRSLSPRKVK